MTQWYETVFNREIRFDSYLRGMGLGADDYMGTQLEKDCNAVLLLKLCPHILFYHNVRNEDWAPAKEALPRMLGKLSSLIETLDK